MEGEDPVRGTPPKRDPAGRLVGMPATPPLAARGRRRGCHGREKFKLFVIDVSALMKMSHALVAFPLIDAINF